MKDRLIKKIAELSTKAIQDYSDQTAPDELFRALCAINDEIVQFDLMIKEIKSKRIEQDSAIFANQLVSWLTKFNVSQARLAKGIGMTSGWLNKCITGKKPFSKGAKRDIKEFLNNHKKL